ncbi:MAG: prepilin-type N-terminal cleavage/methylation domain-containing protein [Rickettsiales bacterium]|nr:prepilin-type N-terminal cleavage/methylation domain-containing protein [Rickettsiales bacterium]
MKNFINKIFVPKKAFSLIELSVVIVILSIVVSGLLSIATNSAINDKIKKTNDNIDKIYQAMGTYLLSSGHLPCPASITAIKSSDADYGNQGNSGTCTNLSGVYNLKLANGGATTNFVYGMVPIRDLGLPNEVAEDGFGSKLGYIVYRDYTSSNTFSSVSTSTGIQVKKNSTPLLDSSNLAMFAIISYGPNKSGAFAVDSATKNTEPSDNDQKDNSPYNLNSAPTIYSDNSATATSIVLRASSSDTTTTFDDTIFFKSRDDMVKDFSAFSLIPCPAVAANSSDANYVRYGTSQYIAWSNGGRYGQNVVADNFSVGSNTPCPTGWLGTVKYPARKCGALGVWEASGGVIYDGGIDPSPIAIPCTQ